MRKLRWGLGLAALLVALSGTAQAEGKDFTGKEAPDFGIEEISFGGEQSLGDFEGKVVLLEFWFLG